MGGLLAFLLRVVKEGMEDRQVGAGRQEGFLPDRLQAQGGVKLRGAGLQGEAAEQSAVNL